MNKLNKRKAGTLLAVGFTVLLSAGCKDKRFERYRAQHNCVYAGDTPDMNGANTGGISSVFKCDNGKYYVVYGGGGGGYR